MAGFPKRPRKLADHEPPPMAGPRAVNQPAVRRPLPTIESLRSDLPAYCEQCLVIADKEGDLVPLRLNYTQRVVLNTIAALRRRRIAPRLVVLKSRQVGVSTITEAAAFHDCHLNPNRNALVTAHNVRSSRAILRMTKRFLANLPGDLKPKRMKSENVNEIHFSHNDSRMQVEVAGEGSRGHTAQIVHLSEFAFYQYDHDTLRAVMQTVPRSVSSLVLVESTANGVGNAFHALWLKAMNRLNDVRAQRAIGYASGFTPIFIPWFKHEEYAIQADFSEHQLTSDERGLIAQHGLTLNQIAWRRWCIETNCNGYEDTFNVEYPTTWRDAFLLSGRPIFHKQGMAYYMSRVPPEAPDSVVPPRCEVSWDEADKRAIIEPSDRGRLLIKEYPKPRHTYILGADPSEGDAGSTPTPIEVLDQMTLCQVAEWWGRLPPDQLAEVAAWLGWYYNTGMIAHEANNHGILFQSTLERLDYPNVYFRMVDENSVAKEVSQKPGFLETNKNKHAIFNTFRQFVREKYDLHRQDETRQLFSPTLIGEMSTAVYVKPQGDSQSATRILPQPGHFIDTCIAFGIALFAHRGTIEAPLEPLPESVIESAELQMMLARERDPEGALATLDMLGISAQEWEAVLERRHRERMSREALGLDGFA